MHWYIIAYCYGIFLRYSYTPQLTQTDIVKSVSILLEHDTIIVETNRQTFILCRRDNLCNISSVTQYSKTISPDSTTHRTI